MKKLNPRQKFIIVIGCVLTIWTVGSLILYKALQLAVKILGQEF